MGTYFADQEQVSKLRMKSRVAAHELMSAKSANEAAAKSEFFQPDSQVVGGEYGGGTSESLTT